MKLVVLAGMPACDGLTCCGALCAGTSSANDFSTTGRSVVDCAIVQSACFDRLDGFEVATVLNLTEDLPVDTASSTPDCFLLFRNYHLQDTLVTDTDLQQGGTDSRKLGDRKTQLKSFQCHPGKMQLFKLDSNKDRALSSPAILKYSRDTMCFIFVPCNLPYQCRLQWGIGAP